MLADRPGMSRTARKTFLKENGYGTLNEATVSRLVLMAKYDTAIRAWRDTLTEHKRDSWNSPTSICNRCPKLRKVIAEANKNKPPRNRRKRDLMLAVQSQLDKLFDLIAAVEDIDNRRALIEQATSSLTKMLPDDQPPTPSRKKRGKAKAAAEPVNDDFSKTAEQVVDEERATETRIAIPALGMVMRIPTVKSD